MRRCGIAGNPDPGGGDLPEKLVGTEGFHSFCPGDFPGGPVMEGPPGFRIFRDRGDGIFSGTEKRAFDEAVPVFCSVHIIHAQHLSVFKFD